MLEPPLKIAQVCPRNTFMTFKALMNISIKNGWLETIQETVGLQITVKCFEIFRITLFNIIYFEWQVFFLRFNWLRSLLAFGFLSQIQETITNTIPYIIEKNSYLHFLSNNFANHIFQLIEIIRIKSS